MDRDGYDTSICYENAHLNFTNENIGAMRVAISTFDILNMVFCDNSLHA